ncbi:MAG: hypothetical protein RKO25_13470 [Candidatus Contendobacter sp.]|nr:hypothetical protein [Candidatus Contendobacter sp.]
MKIAAERVFLMNLFKSLNDACLHYAIMRNYELLPTNIAGSDLDILIVLEDEAMVRKVILHSIKHVNGTAIGCALSHGFFKIFSIGFNNDVENKWWGVCVDVNIGLWFKGINLLNNRQLSDLQITHNGIKVLDLGFAAVLGVLKEVLNNSQMPKRYQIDAAQAVQNDWERLSLALAPMGQKGLTLFRNMILARGGKTDVIRQSRTLRRALFMQAVRSSPMSFARNRFLHEWAKIRRYLHPSGVIVAVLGTDGVGKSTVINAIKPVLDDATHGALEIKHLRPSLLPPLARLKGKQAVQIGPVLDPHGSTPSGTLGSLFRLTYLTLDYVLGYWLVLRPKIAKSPTVILFDRYCYDMALDPRRFRINLDQSVIAWFMRWIPKPNVVLCLHADPSAILMRKQELPLSETIRQVNALRELAQCELGAILVSTEGTIKEVRDNVLAAILNKIKKDNN